MSADAAYYRAWRKSQRCKGLCIHCRRSAEPGKSQCADHATRQRLKDRGRRVPDRVPTFAEFEREEAARQGGVR
jgi:hypothetical protein